MAVAIPSQHSFATVQADCDTVVGRNAEGGRGWWWEAGEEVLVDQ